jgi:hypothetical protein
MTDHNIGIRVGAAGNQAAQILSGSWRALADGSLTREQLVELHADLAADILQSLETLQGSVGLATAFPGTTVATPAEAAPFQQAAQAVQSFQQAAPAAAPSNVVQGPWGQQAGPAPQAPGTQQSKADQEWSQLFANPAGFYDNRGNKRNPNSPDFRAKQGDLGLWLNGKFGPAPQWVLDRLQGGFGPVQ